MKRVDRLTYAAFLARGKRVLDIGGQKMPDCDPESPFARVYACISKASSEYRIVDYQNAPGVDYVADLNTDEGLGRLRKAVEAYRPQVILCMDVLEHLGRPSDVMAIMAESVARCHSEVFITVPNNGNWVFNVLGWNRDHCLAFFKDIARRFIARSPLGGFACEPLACMQTYRWYWPLVYVLSGLQPFNWGFRIGPVAKAGADGGF